MAVVITYKTESGDEGFAGVFSGSGMTNEQWEAWVKENMPEEIADDGFCLVYRNEYHWDGYIKDSLKV